MPGSLLGTSCLFVVLISSVVACQPGRFTDDRRYVGNPERPEATSEAIGKSKDSSGGTVQPDR